MKPFTENLDRVIWELWEVGIAPKDIHTRLNLSSLYVVYNSLHRERRRRGIPLKKAIGRPKNKKKDKKG